MRPPSWLQTRNGWLWSAVICLVTCDIVLRVVVKDEATSSAYARDFVTSQPASDSWRPMALAIERLRSSPGQPVYSQLFFLARPYTKFQYPVSSLVPLDLLQRATGLSWPRLFARLNAASWFAVWLTGVMSWLLLRDGPAFRGGARGKPTFASTVSGLAATLVLTLLFYPLTWSYLLGQVQTLVTMLATAALVQWQAGRERTSGVLLGFCCAIKPQWAVGVLWACVRRQWRLASSAACSAAVVVLLSIGMYGFAQYPDYARVLAYISRHGETFFPNQSMNGLLNRVLQNGSSLEWLSDQFPPFHPVVYWGTVATSAALLLAVLLWRRRTRPTTLDMALMILSLTIASPVAWNHHYGVLLPIFALLLSGNGRLVRGGEAWVLLIAFLLAAQPLGFTRHYAHTPLNVVQSTLFGAAVLTLLLLARAVPRAQVDAPDSEAAQEGSRQRTRRAASSASLQS